MIPDLYFNGIPVCRHYKRVQLGQLPDKTTMTVKHGIVSPFPFESSIILKSSEGMYFPHPPKLEDEVMITFTKERIVVYAECDASDFTGVVGITYYKLCESCETGEGKC